MKTIERAVMETVHMADQKRITPHAWYRWFHRDWMTSATVAGFSAATRGVYREMIDAYMEPRNLPSDPKTLAIILRLSPEEVVEAVKILLRAKVIERGKGADIGRLFLPKVEQKLTCISDAKKAASRSNGNSGGRPRKPEKPEVKTYGKSAVGFGLEPTDSPTRAGAPSVSVSVSESGFKLFWNDYPRKEAKQDAERAWKALKPNQDLIYKIAGDLEGRRHSDQWTKNKGQFIPLPATYIRARRWEDEGIDHLRPSAQCDFYQDRNAEVDATLARKEAQRVARTGLNGDAK